MICRATGKSKFKPAPMTAQVNIDACIINETELKSRFVSYRLSYCS